MVQAISRLAVVTGGTRGIGAAISKELLRQGYRVVANYASDQESAHAFSKETGIPVLQWNVADHGACSAYCQSIMQQHGPIEILINNAGITRDRVFHSMALEEWRQVMAVNLDGIFNMSSAVFPSMRERRWGRIVNISSINGQAGQFGQVNYSAAKAGVLGFTKALAAEGAKAGITVNAIAPGYIETEMVAAVPAPVLEKIIAKIPAQRLGKAFEIARGVAFLVSDDAGFANGTTLTINGGQYMC